MQLHTLENALRQNTIPAGAIPIYDRDTEKSGPVLLCSDDNGKLTHTDSDRVLIPVWVPTRKHAGVYTLLVKAAQLGGGIKKATLNKLQFLLPRLLDGKPIVNVFVSPDDYEVISRIVTTYKVYADYRIPKKTIICCADPDYVGIFAYYPKSYICGAACFNTKMVRILKFK